jgi:hypothetical protein
MNDKPFTLYYIPQLKNINCANFPTNAGKISDVRTVSKGISLLGFKGNSNHYMIVGDNSSIISMGMVKKIETKNKNIIYIGQRIYSSSQKELYDYIKREITKRIQSIQKQIAKIQDIKRISTILGFDVYDEYINQMYRQIKTIKTNSKELIANFKKV